MQILATVTIPIHVTLLLVLLVHCLEVSVLGAICSVCLRAFIRPSVRACVRASFGSCACDFFSAFVFFSIIYLVVFIELSVTCFSLPVLPSPDTRHVFVFAFAREIEPRIEIYLASVLLFPA